MKKNKELEKAMLKHLNDDLTNTEKDVFKVELPYVDYLNEKYHGLNLEVVLSLSSAEEDIDPEENHGFYFDYFVGMNTKLLKNQSKEYFEWTGLHNMDTDSFVSMEETCQDYVDYLKNIKLTKLDKECMKNMKLNFKARGKDTNQISLELLSTLTTPEEASAFEEKVYNVLD